MRAMRDLGTVVEWAVGGGTSSVVSSGRAKCTMVAVTEGSWASWRTRRRAVLSSSLPK